MYAPKGSAYLARLCVMRNNICYCLCQIRGKIKAPSPFLYSVPHGGTLMARVAQGVVQVVLRLCVCAGFTCFVCVFTWVPRCGLHLHGARTVDIAPQHGFEHPNSDEPCQRFTEGPGNVNCNVSSRVHPLTQSIQQTNISSRVEL